MKAILLAVLLFSCGNAGKQQATTSPNKMMDTEVQPATTPAPAHTETPVPELFFYGDKFTDPAQGERYFNLWWAESNKSNVVRFTLRYLEGDNYVDEVAELSGVPAAEITKVATSLQTFQEVSQKCESGKDPVGKQGRVWRYRPIGGGPPLRFWCGEQQLDSAQKLTQWREKIMAAPKKYGIEKQIDETGP